MIPALLLTQALIGGVVDGSFVYRACFISKDSREISDVTGRPAPDRAAADLCVFQQTCEAAEVVIRVDPAAQRAYWISSSPEKCR